MNDDIAIKVEGVAKRFARHKEKTSIKSTIVNVFKGKEAKQKDDFQVLKDISFEVKKGDFFGIVGRNGSGKSTLLKIISEIYKPTSGNVTVNGSLVPFIELGVGFNPELTGRENVFLNGALLGFSRKEMEEKYDEIVAFAELEEYMDEKLKNYSSGMQVRLAFSVAIRADADILVLDEVLAVGDEAFQKKCEDYFYSLKRRNKTVILVTHSMEAVRGFCNKAILINKGHVVASGNPDKVASQYSEIFQKEQVAELEKQASSGEFSSNESTYIQNAVVLSELKVTNVIGFKKEIKLQIDVQSDQKYDNVTMGVHVVHQSGQVISAITTKTFGDQTEIKKGLNIFEFDIQNIFSEGSYTLNVALKDKETGGFLIQEGGICPFSVVGVDASKYNPSSLVYPDVSLKIIRK